LWGRKGMVFSEEVIKQTKKKDELGSKGYAGKGQ
jgi:hypothetical protein